MLKQTEPILKTRQHKESFKMQNNSMQNSYSVFIVHVVQYANMKEKMQWLSVWDVMSGSTRSAKKYLVKCLPVIASDFLEHSQVNWSVNFYLFW